MKKIVFFGDLPRFHKTNPFHADRMTKTVHELFKGQIAAATGVTPELVLARDGARFSRERFYSLSGHGEPSEEGWVRIVSGEYDDSAAAYFADCFRDSLVISHEAGSLIRVMDDAGISYIDLRVAPVRFLDDILFCFKSNTLGVTERLLRYRMELDEMEFHVNRLRARYCSMTGIEDVGKKLACAGVKPNSLLLCGQSGADLSLIRDGSMVTLDDCLENLNKAMGEVFAVDLSDMGRIARPQLAEDSWRYIKNASGTKQRALASRQRQQQPPLRIAVLGSTTTELLQAALKKELDALIPDRRVEYYTVPYGQLLREMLDRSSDLVKFAPEIAILCDRPEDILGQFSFESLSEGRAREQIQQYASVLSAWADSNECRLIAHRFSFFEPAVSLSRENSERTFLDSMNAVFENALPPSPRTIWVDAGRLAASISTVSTDARLRFHGRIPFSLPMTAALARKWAGVVLSLLGRTCRALVLDLDNTLWGGVLGEDGVGGVKIGGDYPGNAFKEFQRVIKSLSQQGIALAVCSKNNEKEALSAMDSLPEMLIRSADLAAHRIGWEEKWRELQAIADALHLGTGSLLFIDDNPRERETVRIHLPDVKVLDLPSVPEGYLDALRSCPWVEITAATAEDLNRNNQFAVMVRIDQEKKAAQSLEDFYAGLEMTLNFAPLSEGNAMRAEQLCQKTNQFNTTVRRHRIADLQRMVDDGGEVYVVGLSDKFSPSENIGLITLVPDAKTLHAGIIESYLLSCRVLGRGLEAPIVRWAINRAGQLGWKRLTGEIIETERNVPVRGVFREAGMCFVPEENLWFVETSPPKPIPSWLKISCSV